MDMEQILADAQRRITVGQGGADVYELKGERIAKHIRREGLPHDQSWARYMAEAQFYGSEQAKKKTFVPEILHCEWNEDEILIVMRQYRPLERQRMNGGMLEKALDVLAQIHAMPPLESDVRKRSGPQILGEAEIVQCLSGWRSVLAEHGSAFPADALENIAERINDVNRSAYSARQCFCHGDFHVENLLVDENDNIIVCD